MIQRTSQKRPATWLLRLASCALAAGLTLSARADDRYSQPPAAPRPAHHLRPDLPVRLLPARQRLPVLQGPGRQAGEVPQGPDDVDRDAAAHPAGIAQSDRPVAPQDRDHAAGAANATHPGAVL